MTIACVSGSAVGDASAIASAPAEAYGRPWDVFVSDPGNTAEHEVKTGVNYPVK